MNLVKDCDLLISVGTSGILMPAANIPEIALASGASVIHINKTDVSLDGSNEYMLLGPAAGILPMLIDYVDPD